MNEYTVTQAARFVNRIWAPIAEGLEVANAADAGFDGGEFSDGFHAQQYDQLLEHTFQVVADRTGYTKSEITQEMYRQDMVWWPGQ